MTDPAEQPKLQPTEYNYFLDDDGDVWRQATEDGPHEIMAPDSWLVSHPGSHLALRALIIGKPPLPTEPGLYVVNYSKDRPLRLHEIVCLEGTEWHHLDSWYRWTPSDGDTLTRLDVAEGKK